MTACCGRRTSRGGVLEEGNCCCGGVVCRCCFCVGLGKDAGGSGLGKGCSLYVGLLVWDMSGWMIISELYDYSVMSVGMIMSSIVLT